MKHVFPVVLAAAMGAASPLLAKSFDEMFPGMDAQMPEELRPGLAGMDLQQGRVFVGGSIASIDVPEDYCFLGPEGAGFVLAALWGNPDSPGTLGMLFTARYLPLHKESWGIEITFGEIGYVSDEDAGSSDCDALLKTMQKDTRDENAWREQKGYAPIELMGWAAEPHYDAEAARSAGRACWSSTSSRGWTASARWRPRRPR